MLKVYDAKYESEPYPPQKTIVYRRDRSSYMVVNSEIDLKLFLVSRDDFHRYIAGERSHIVPDFDPLKYSLDICWTGHDLIAPTMHLEGYPLILRERVEKPRVKIPNGLYRLDSSDEGVELFPMQISTDRYVGVRTGAHQIYQLLKDFVESRDRYAQEGVRHKEGILLYGPQGNGKTREVCEILDKSSPLGIISIYIPSSFQDLSELQPFRQPLEGRVVVFVLEELTQRTDGDDYEDLLSFLDGQTSWDHSFVIATTNYPEKLAWNIVDRPGRFDLVLEFSNPSSEERMRYLLGRGVGEEEAKKASDMAEGLSLDYLAQSVTHSRIKQISICDYLKYQKETRSKIVDRFKEPVGFGRSRGLIND